MATFSGTEGELSRTRTELLTFLRDRAGLDATFDASRDLLASGVLDSLLLIDLVLYIERVFGVTLDSNDVAPANFRTIETLAGLVDRRMDSSPRRVA
ncbi:MAG: acyl carrier protein [Planctomycetaceae bacterium]|nr:MAG: acyl carrier protein [Planctomycetaceae bacterium]